LSIAGRAVAARFALTVTVTGAGLSATRAIAIATRATVRSLSLRSSMAVATPIAPRLPLATRS
jgi:hypothetical protein